MSDDDADAGLERVLEHLRQTRGFDFTAYKRTTLTRRVRKRMEAVGVADFDAYLDYLQVRPDEFPALFNTILINVTSFFRDPEVWEALGASVLPHLAADRDAALPIRVWSAGAASGQEPYSVAMLMAEAIGIDAFRERVKIYATDVDEEALAQARRAVYDARQIEDVPPQLCAKYFDENDAGLYIFNRDLRRSVIFGRHDLIQDAPISRVDLLLCRNTLMYFNAEAQGRIMARFRFCVNPGGHLVVGRAEMLFSHLSSFEPVDLKRRIFRKVADPHPRERPPVAPSTEDNVPQPTPLSRLREAAFDVSGDAQIVLDASDKVIAANVAARRQFGISESDIGSPLQDLEVSYRPAELRSAVGRARAERRDIALRGVSCDQPGGATRFLDVVVMPLFDEERALLGIRISFDDVTTVKKLQEELGHSKQELETAYEELQSTNEELETTNEELQSTVEELETTNEELQSTNEELETMNEELQTMNDELRTRGALLNSNNVFLEAVFGGLRSAVIVLDREMRVLVWNTGATDLWGARPDETRGVAFKKLDIGLPVQDIEQPVREVLSGAQSWRELSLQATNRKGRTITCHVMVAPLYDPDRALTGAILLMEER